VDGALASNGGPAPAAIILLALLLDAYVGDARRLRQLPFHPFQILDRALDWIDGKLNRRQRGGAALRIRGAIVVLILLAAAAALGGVVDWVAEATLLGWTLELVLVTIAVACRGTHDRARLVADALEDASLAEARETARALGPRPTTELDDHGVARYAIESVATGFAARVVAPVLYYAIFGLAGTLVYAATLAMQDRIGRTDPEHRDFGRPTRVVHNLLQWLPARLAAALIGAAAVLRPRLQPLEALRTAVRDARRHPLGAEAWPQAAMAGALDLALAGPRRYPLHVMELPWVGRGRARAVPADVYLALALYRAASAAIAGAALLVLVAGWLD